MKQNANSVATVLVALATTTVLADVELRVLQPVIGGDETWAFGVNADGTIAVGRGRGSESDALRWALPGEPMTIGLRRMSIAEAVSADGSTVVGYDDGAFRWTSSGGHQMLGDLPLPEVVGSTALGVSDDGSTVVGFSYSDVNSAAFSWTEGTGMIALPVPPGTEFSEAFDASADGSVIVGNIDGLAALWHADGTFESLGSPGGVGFSLGHAISDDGTVVAGQLIGSGGGAFRWTRRGGFVDLGVLPGAGRSNAHAISGDGRTVVGVATRLVGEDSAVLWNESTGLVELHDYLADLGASVAFWRFVEATGVSADGSAIVGWGYYRDERRGFLVTGLPLGESCEADFDGDGELTLFDFLAFQNAFGMGDPLADFDGDGDLTLFDFLAFQNAFDAGCD